MSDYGKVDFEAYQLLCEEMDSMEKRCNRLKEALTKIASHSIRHTCARCIATAKQALEVDSARGDKGE